MRRRGELKVGLVGRRAQAFVAGFRSMPECQVVAFCDLNPETLQTIADRHQISERYRDFDVMVEKDLDVVVVATPMPFLAPQSAAALTHGKHVLAEVTAAVSLDECQLLVEAVRASGRKYMMAENYCYNKPNSMIRHMVREGLFGEIYYAEGAYLHDCHSVHYDSEGNPTWRATWQVGKRGCTYGTHSLGPLLQWFDDSVATVSCQGSGVHTDPSHVMDDIVTMICKTTRGALLDVRLDMQSHRPHNMTHYVLQGTKGAYHSARRRGEPNLIWLEGRSPDAQTWQSLEEYESEFLPEPWRSLGPEAAQAGHGGGDYFVVRDFAQSILNDTTPPIDVYRALDFTVPGLVSEESIARGGVPLPVPDFRALSNTPSQR